MITEIKYVNGTRKTCCKVCCVGVLGSRPDCLYIQTKVRGCVREFSVRLDTIKTYHTREAIK